MGTISVVDDHRHEDWREFSTFGDLERCPYPPFTQAAFDWCKQDDVRMRRLALARRPVAKTCEVYSLCVLCRNKWRRYLKGGGPREGFTVVVS